MCRLPRFRRPESSRRVLDFRNREGGDNFRRRRDYGGEVWIRIGSAWAYAGEKLFTDCHFSRTDPFINWPKDFLFVADPGYAFTRSYDLR
jgi:hypothetical protein